MENGKSRARLSWQSSMDYPEAVIYEGLDPDAAYIVRVAGYGQSLLRINGDLIAPALYEKGLGEFKEFPVPAAALKDRKLTITWDRPTDEGHLNWRQRSRIAEIWLLKQ